MTRKAKVMQVKAKRCTVAPVGMTNNAFNVTSCTSGNTYRVYVNPTSGIFSCSCDWGHYHSGESGCSHVVAAMEYKAQQVGESTSVFTPETVTAQHRRVVASVNGICITQRGH